MNSWLTWTNHLNLVYRDNVPIILSPTILPGVVGGEGWVFEQSDDWIPHHLDVSGDQILF